MIREDVISVLKASESYALIPCKVLEKFLKTENIIKISKFLDDNDGCFVPLDPCSNYDVIKKYKIVNENGKKWTDAFLEIRGKETLGNAERLLLKNEVTEEEFIANKVEKQGLKMPEHINFIEEFHKEWEDSLA